MCKECNDGTIKVALSRLADEIMENNTKLGWEPDATRTFGDECALLHEEVTEAFKAWRKRGFEDMTEPAVHKAGCDLADHRVYGMPLPEPDCTCGALPKPEGVASEFADIFIRLLHYSAVHEIDLIGETRRKMEYNATREYRHGGQKL